MPPNNAPRDQNYVPVATAQNAIDPTEVLPIQVNPSTGGLLVESA